MALDICAAGCITPIGLSLAETAAAARARVARLREGVWQDRRGDPYIVGALADDKLPVLSEVLCAEALDMREARMLRLGHAALAEALATLPEGTEVPLLLGLPEHHNLRPIDPLAFLRRLAIQSRAPLDLARSLEG